MMGMSDREQLALDNIDLIDIVLNQTRRIWCCCHRADVRQAAFDGYGAAVARWDPHKGASIRTYASYRIRGAILDYVRSESCARRIRAECADWQQLQPHPVEPAPEDAYCLDVAAIRKGCRMAAPAYRRIG